MFASSKAPLAKDVDYRAHLRDLPTDNGWVMGVPLSKNRSAILSSEVSSTSTYSVLIVSFLLVHVLIGVVLRQSSTVAGLHAIIALAVSIWAAVRWSDVAIASCCAYIVGAEVLWRIAGAPIPYEFGKYAVSLVFLIALVRMGRRAVWRVAPLLYFVVLLPSAALVFSDQDLFTRMVMMRVSFNLSGPLSLFISVWFFSQQRFRSEDILKIGFALLGPLLAIAVVTIIATRTATDLTFTGESNKVTSGGFGPNQVSLALGLGALVAFLSSLNRDAGVVARMTSAALVLLFATQSALTFSRGGLYSAALALIAGAPFLLVERRTRRVLVPLGAVIAIAATSVVLPRIDQFTGGKLGERFQETQATSRGELIVNDIEVWFDHPVFGVGPGMVQEFRSEASGSGHTEYTRLLAEHGSFGFVALAALVLMSLQVLLDSGDPVSRGYRIIFLVWALVSMLHAAMRIAAFGFIFGLAHATFQLIHRRSLEFNLNSETRTLAG